MNIPFIDLQAQYEQVKPAAEKAVKGVFKRGDFILGQDVKLFEEEFARYCGSRFALGVNSGTDALFLSLVAMGIGPGDEVIVPDFTFIATAFVVSCCGAKPVFADIDEKTYCIDPAAIEKAITPRTKAIIPVHLFGQCADMKPILALAKKHGLKVIEDACQAHGALYCGKKSGSFGDTGCFSFYPTKNLGGCGDGGMIVTDNETLYRRLYKLRDCGRKTKYEHEIIGYNSRLDTLQAALLRVKLKKLDAWNKKRQQAGAAYDRLFTKARLPVQLPQRAAYSSHVFHIYSIRMKKRDQVAQYVRGHGIGVMVNYPVPLHCQEAYATLPGAPADACPAAVRLSQEILSLPMDPCITEKKIAHVVSTIGEALHAV